MTKWYVIDDMTSKAAVMYPTACDSKEEALKKAEIDWNSLTDHDKARRDSFFVGLCEVDEDGEVGDVIEIAKSFK